MDERVQLFSWSINFVQDRRKKTIKIEVFSAADWARKYRTGSMKFSPRPSVHQDLSWWDNYYRIRIGRKWYGDAAKYHLFDRGSLFELLWKLSGGD